MTNRTRLGVTRALAFILIYLFQLIGGIVFLISERHDREIRYHGIMSCSLCVTHIVTVLIFKLLTNVPIIGWLFTFGLWLITVGYIAVMLLSMIRALHGTRLVLPFFTAFADKRA